MPIVSALQHKTYLIFPKNTNAYIGLVVVALCSVWDMHKNAPQVPKPYTQSVQTIPTHSTNEDKGGNSRRQK